MYVDGTHIPINSLTVFFIGIRLGKNRFSETNTKFANYNSKLDRLMQELRDEASLEVRSEVQHVREDLSLDSLVYAGQVGLNEAKKCLDGTRTEILNEIIDWINNTDASAPRIFWLHGQAGKGKSAVAHTIALYARNLGMLGSFFCFTRVRQREGLHTKLFPTIARNLADRDARLRLILAKVISGDPSLTGTEDIMEQWKMFILQPLSRLEGSSTGNVVVVIDALDESGWEGTRVSILEALTESGGKLPINIRIFLTSRPLADIWEALDASEHVHSRSLDNTNVGLTMSDIRRYVSYRLKNHSNIFSNEDIQQISVKSDGLFEWARLACDFVSHRIEVTAKKRLNKIMSYAPGDFGTLRDGMYTVFLKEFIEGSPRELVVFQSVMRQILWSKEPLSMSALDFMRGRFPRVDDRYPVTDTLRLMASQLSGTDVMFVPVRPVHASFYDFLLDEQRSGEFFVHEEDVHFDLAFASLSVMCSYLCFNICGLETSYVPNAEIVDLDKRVKENIPSHLLYACRFWATHLQEAEFNVELAKLVHQFIIGEQILFWLEVLGVSKLIREAYWALTSAERWFQVSILFCYKPECCINHDNREKRGMKRS